MYYWSTDYPLDTYNLLSCNMTFEKVNTKIIVEEKIRWERTKIQPSENKYNCDKSKRWSEFVHRRANRGAEEKIISAQTAVDSFRSLRTEFVSTRFRETRFSCRGSEGRGKKIGRNSLFRARRFRSDGIISSRSWPITSYWTWRIEIVRRSRRPASRCTNKTPVNMKHSHHV